MTFPISVHFKKRLKAIITDDNQQQILQYIIKSISEDKADNIVAEDSRVTYKGSTSNWNGSLFRTIDDGAFNFIYKDAAWWLDYQINMRKMFVVTAIMSTVMGIYAQVNGDLWWVGIIAFLWLCGANWIINLIRHGNVAAEIASGIDELICGKEQEPDYASYDGPLKSWF